MSYKKVVVETTEKKTRFQDVRCDNCDAPLENGFGSHDLDEDGNWKGLQGKDALRFQLLGSYAGYFDSMAFDPVLMFCKDCADKLVKAFPIIQEAIDAAWDNYSFGERIDEPAS